MEVESESDDRGILAMDPDVPVGSFIDEDPDRHPCQVPTMADGSTSVAAGSVVVVLACVVVVGIVVVVVGGGRVVAVMGSVVVLVPSRLVVVSIVSDEEQAVSSNAGAMAVARSPTTVRSANHSP